MTDVSPWYVYMIETRCGLLYTGIATDIARRFAEHQARFEGRSAKGARFFNGREPLRIVYHEPHSDRSSATRREIAIKRLSLTRKRQLIAVSADDSETCASTNADKQFGTGATPSTHCFKNPA